MFLEALVSAGLIFYILGWITYFMVTSQMKMAREAKTTYFIYTLIPWNFVFAGGGVYTASCLGILDLA